MAKMTSLISSPHVLFNSLHWKNSIANEKQPPEQPIYSSPPVSPRSKPIRTDAQSTSPPSNSSGGLSHSLDKEHADALCRQKLCTLVVPDEYDEPTSQSLQGEFAKAKMVHDQSVVSLRSRVIDCFTTNRREWLRRESAFLEIDRQANRQKQRRAQQTEPIAASLARSPSIQSDCKILTQRKLNTATLWTMQVADLSRSCVVPEPTCRKVTRQDKNFDSIPNFCPPLESLPCTGNSFQVDMQSQPVDLVHTPFARLLHPDELLLAGNLKLDCATYLTSKRRIFKRRLDCFRNNKKFRKTDAQKACRIDVNKASKLWIAFERVGWLDKQWMAQYTNERIPI